MPLEIIRGNKRSTINELPIQAAKDLRFVRFCVPGFQIEVYRDYVHVIVEDTGEIRRFEPLNHPSKHDVTKILRAIRRAIDFVIRRLEQ